MRVEGLTNHWGKYLRWWKMFVMMKINIKQIIFLELLLLLFNVWGKLSVPWLYTLIILSISFQQNKKNLCFCISPFKVKWPCAFTSHKWNIIRFIFIFIIRNRIRFKWKKNGGKIPESFLQNINIITSDIWTRGTGSFHCSKCPGRSSISNPVLSLVT